jgi:hypothetical protein
MIWHVLVAKKKTRVINLLKSAEQNDKKTFQKVKEEKEIKIILMIRNNSKQDVELELTV